MILFFQAHFSENSKMPSLMLFIIDVLVENNSAGILQNCPYINNLHYLKKKYRDIFYYLNLFKNYDTIYFLKNDHFLSICALLAGVKNRIGFDVSRNIGLTLKVPYGEDKHEIDYYLDQLRATQIPVNNVNTELWLNKEKTDSVQNILNKLNGTKILIHASSRFRLKNWNSYKWNEIIHRLTTDYNCSIIFVGGEKDKEVYDEILNVNQNTDNKKIFNLCGKLKIQETVELVNDMDLIIGIDSGVMHIAAALNIPSVLLNGPTSLVKWMPRSEKCTVVKGNYNCTPCLFNHGKKLCTNLKIAKCMDMITVEYIKEFQQTKSNIDLIINNENQGYSKGNNIGIKSVLNKDYKYIALLNNDILFTPDWLENSINAFEKDKQLGMVSPRNNEKFSFSANTNIKGYKKY